MKRSARIERERREQARYEMPHHNTYYEPVGKPPKKKRGKSVFLTLFTLFLGLVFIFLAAMYVWSLREDVDDLRGIEDKATFVSSENMHDYTKGAFIALEDERFYKHGGYDLKGISRALFSTLSDNSKQGGSTITQQVVKNYFYSNEPSYTRKIKELFVAYRVEKAYSKEEILSFYMNNIYFGANQYTIESAAQHYFGTTTNKHNTQLPQITVLQSAILASKINAPSVYDVNNMSDNFINRVKINLEKMKQQGYISEQAYQTALQQLGI